MFTLILAGIFIAWYNFTPIIIETPEPNLTVDISPFIEAGCVKKKNYLDCSKINLEKKFNWSSVIFLVLATLFQETESIFR